MLKAILIGIIVTIVGLAMLSSVDKKGGILSSLSSATNQEQTQENEKTGEIKFSISGEVLYPGDYYLTASSTLQELIDAAGGLTSKADSSAFNPNIALGSHTSFYIPPSSEKESSCVETEILKININTATANELVTAGFTSSQSKAIVDYRTTNGNFTCIEDIINVKGVGQGTFEKVKNKITIS